MCLRLDVICIPLPCVCDCNDNKLEMNQVFIVHIMQRAAVVLQKQ